MLTGEPAFEGDRPLEIMQSVLSRRIPPVSSKRMDIPEALSAVVAKMTAKNIEERYNSVSGLKYDLTELNRILCDGDVELLKAFKVATKDVSSFFSLPSRLIGRDQERQIILDVVDRVSRSQHPSLKKSLYSFGSTSGSSLSSRPDNPPLDDIVDMRSDSTSSRGSDHHRNESRTPRNNSEASVSLAEPSENRHSTESWASSNWSVDHPARRTSSAQNALVSDDPAETLRNHHRFRKKTHCELIAVSGQGGYGKSSLIQSVQPIVRGRGFYFATSKVSNGNLDPCCIEQPNTPPPRRCDRPRLPWNISSRWFYYLTYLSLQ